MVPLHTLPSRVAAGVGARVVTAVRAGWSELRRRPSHQLRELDALRSAAILIVVFHHWAIKEYERAGGVRSALQDNPLFSYGWAGVDLFFVLSGYLIGRQLWRELDRTGTVQFGRFILRRGFRIWPIYFAILLWYAAFSGVIHPRLSDWAFISNYSFGGFPRGWSLSTEEHFYIAVPLLLLLLRKRIRLASYVWVVLAIEGAVLLNRYRTIDGYVAAGRALEPVPWTLVTPFHLHLEGLLAGLLIALVSIVWPHQLRPATGVSGISGQGLAVFGGATAVALVLRASHDTLFSFLALGMIFGGATYWALRDRSLLSAPLRWSIWYPISRLSYSMYLNHWFIWPKSNEAIVAAAQLVSSSPAVVFLLSMLAGTVLSVGIAVVMFVVVELPFLHLRDRLLASTSAPPIPLPAAPIVKGAA